MIKWLKALFGRGEEFVVSTKLYGEVMDRTQETQGLISATLDALSEEQVAAQQKIDTLLHEATMARVRIQDGANKALHLQKIRDTLTEAVGDLKETLEDVIDDIQDKADAI